MSNKIPRIIANPYVTINSEGDPVAFDLLSSSAYSQDSYGRKMIRVSLCDEPKMSWEESVNANIAVLKKLAETSETYSDYLKLYKNPNPTTLEGHVPDLSNWKGADWKCL